MENGEETRIHWEEETIFYQNRLEEALEYLHNLEIEKVQLQATINQQAQIIKRQLEQIALVTDLEERIRHLQTEIANRSKIILDLQKNNNKLSRENRQYKRAYQEQEEGSEQFAERFKTLQSKAEHQAEQIAQLEQTLQIQQRLLRRQRES